MKNNSLDEIIKCDIDLSTPSSSDETFDSICIVVPGPSSKTKNSQSTDIVFAITEAKELLDYGFDVKDAAYLAASTAFSQNPSPDKIYVAVRKSETVDGTTTYEEIATALDRAYEESGAYGYHITEFGDSKDVTGAISWAETNQRLFGFEYTDYEKCPIKNFGFFYSFGFYAGNADGYKSDEQPAENNYMALGTMAKCFGYTPGSESWDSKVLSTFVPSALSTKQKKWTEENHINTFRRYCGSNVTFGGYVLAGEWIDVIRFRDWLKNRIQTNAFNVKRMNTKVPFTDGGIGLFEGAVNKALADGQSNGGIAPTEYDGDGNEIPGYSVTVPLAADCSEEERQTRKLSGIMWSARLAGAIHLAEIKGNLRV